MNNKMIRLYPNDTFSLYFITISSIKHVILNYSFYQPCNMSC